jgi:hypothetical protein
MYKRSLVTLALILVLSAGSFLLAGCSKTDKDLVGVWEQLKGPTTYTVVVPDEYSAGYVGMVFNEDRSAALLVSDLQDPGYPFLTDPDFRYTASGGVLKVTDAAGNLLIFRNTAISFTGLYTIEEDSAGEIVLAVEVEDGKILHFVKYDHPVTAG